MYIFCFLKLADCKESNTTEYVHTQRGQKLFIFSLLLISWSMYPPISWVWTKTIKGEEARSKTVFQNTGYTVKLRKQIALLDNSDPHEHRHSHTFLKSKEFWGIHSVQFTQSCLTLCDFMNCSTPGFLSTTNSQSLLNLMSIASMTPSNHLILCRPLLLLPSIFPSIKIFSNEFWKYWSFSFSISPSNESS